MGELKVEHLIDQVNKHEIYNKQGVLLLPKYVKLTKERIEWLMQHDIELTDDDVTTFDQEKYEKVIDDAVDESKEIFEEVREQTSLPLSHVHENIVPVITQMSQEAHIIDLFVSLQAKDDYTYRHNIAVGTLASLVGQWLHLSEEEILVLSTAGFLHDIGKMRIPESILNKPGSLTEQEFAFMKKHTLFGYEIIRDTVGTVNREALVALQHHERMDGSGYPYGLKRDDIDFFSRIISVVDVFHAMTSKRVYRDASPLYEVLHQMNDDTFGVLDPRITRLFIEKMMMSLINHKILLTNGQTGHIVLINQNDPIHPLIQVGDQFFDLSKDRSLHIKSVVD